MARLNLASKYSLEGVSEGWTDEHFLSFKTFSSEVSMTCADDMKDIKENDNRAFIEVFKKYAKQQFVGGRVLVDTKTVEAELDDIDDLPAPIITDIFTQISRSKFSDPKASNPAL